jgi:general secretion pathway protein K
MTDYYGEKWYTFWENQKEQPLLRFTTGELTMDAIVDESGKFPINGLINDNGTVNPAMKEMFVRLLENELKLPQLQARTLAAAVVDWLDKDEQITDQIGAESNYYQALENPYKCHNAPMTSLDELMLVRGVKPEVFYGEKGGGSSEIPDVVGTKIN